MRRLAMITLSLSLVLGLTATPRMFAQDEKKADAPKADEKKDAPKADEKKADAPKADEKKDAPKADEKKDAPKADEKKDAPKADAKKDDTAKSEATPPPIPPEVQAKLEAARRAVAEAIVAAQDAGLVNTSIDPPPILDILITGRATDEQALKARTGVSPEVFGAWFTGYGRTQGINYEKDVRIVNPSAGLKQWYQQRADMLSSHIKAVRDAKAKSEPAKKAEEPAKKAEEPAKKAEEPAKK